MRGLDRFDGISEYLPGRHLAPCSGSVFVLYAIELLSQDSDEVRRGHVQIWSLNFDLSELDRARALIIIVARVDSEFPVVTVVKRLLFGFQNHRWYGSGKRVYS